MSDFRNEQEFLAEYEPALYERLSVTVDILVFAVNQALNALKILLIRRKDPPYIHCWSLLGGLVKKEESLEDAARRKLEEETGLKDIYVEQLFTYGDPGRAPDHRVISISYMALIQENKAVVTPGDNAEACWFTLRERENIVELHGDNGEVLEYQVSRIPILIGGVPSIQETAYKHTGSGIAFDHEKAIQTGIRRLRNKAEYTNILFGLMPREFTLPELQRLYETVLGKQLYKANFRKKISRYVEATGRKKNQEGARRSPELYRFCTRVCRTETDDGLIGRIES